MGGRSSSFRSSNRRELNSLAGKLEDEARLSSVSTTPEYAGLYRSWAKNIRSGQVSVDEARRMYKLAHGNRP